MDTPSPSQHAAAAPPDTKHGLALAYFPTLKAAAAERKLRRWINGNPHLMKRLKRHGYSNCQKRLTPTQMRIIFGVLGAP